MCRIHTNEIHGDKNSGDHCWNPSNVGDVGGVIARNGDGVVCTTFFLVCFGRFCTHFAWLNFLILKCIVLSWWFVMLQNSMTTKDKQLPTGISPSLQGLSSFSHICPIQFAIFHHPWTPNAQRAPPSMISSASWHLTHEETRPGENLDENTSKLIWNPKKYEFRKMTFRFNNCTVLWKTRRFLGRLKGCSDLFLQECLAAIAVQFACLNESCLCPNFEAPAGWKTPSIPSSRRLLMGHPKVASADWKDPVVDHAAASKRHFNV